MIDVRGREFKATKNVTGNKYKNVQVYEGQDGERYVTHYYSDDRKKLTSLRQYVQEQLDFNNMGQKEYADYMGIRVADVNQLLGTDTDRTVYGYESVISQRLVDQLGIRADVENLSLWKYYNE